MEKKILVLTLIAWMISISSVFASENYVVGVGDCAYYPHHTYSDNEYSGFARDILDLFAQKHDITFDYRALHWKRVVKEFVEGDLDFVFPDNSQWDTAKKKGKQVHYSDPVVQYIDILHTDQKVVYTF